MLSKGFRTRSCGSMTGREVLSSITSWASSFAMHSSGSRLCGKKVSLVHVRTSKYAKSLSSLVIIDQLVAPHLSSIIYFVGLSAALGTTLSLSLASDLLALVTLHLYAFYFMATAVFSFHVRAMGSLFNIFRGKTLSSCLHA